MIDLKKPRIIIHNLTLKGIENVPGVLDFDQRGIVGARSGDVVVTKHAPDPQFLAYLTSLGWDFSDVSFISPKNLNGYTYKSIFYDKKVIEYSMNSGASYIDAYQNTHEEEGFGVRTGLPVYANARLGLTYGTKSGFRALAKKLKLPIPRGFELVKSKEAAWKAVKKLFDLGAEKIIIKIDEGLSGAGQTMLKKSEYTSLALRDQKRILQKALTKIPQFGKHSAATVEEWVQGAVASPSIQLEVTPKRNIRVVSMKDQILEGEEKWYIGCSYPVSSLTRRQQKLFIRDAKIFTQALAEQGFQGFLGMDSILFSDGTFLWVEANVRKPGTYYPRVIAEKINGGSLSGMYYIASDFTVSAFKGASFAKLAAVLKPYLYPVRGDKHGVIIYNTGALLDAGRFDLICIGQSAKDARTHFTKVKVLLDSLK